MKLSAWEFFAESCEASASLVQIEAVQGALLVRPEIILHLRSYRESVRHFEGE